MLTDYGIAPEERSQLHANASRVAAVARLPFRRQIWHGANGNWQGAGTGTSIDFQDHRQYFPGDDPRYINWQAYARTGSYTMKLYREEVSPTIDLVLDASASMFTHAAKARRVVELFHFIVESALAAGSMLRCYQIVPGKVRPDALELIQSDGWEPLIPDEESSQASTGRAEAPDFGLVPWRQNSMRIILSDLLFPGAPEAILSPLAQSPSLVLFFCPWCEAEAHPEWMGNIELSSSETAEWRKLRFTSRESDVYQQRYRQHFELWREACARRGYVFGRVDAESSLQDALLREPFEMGLVELWK